MAGSDDALVALREALLSNGPAEPTWQTGADLARMSFENLVGRSEFGRELPSLGRMRLSGDGIHGHTATLDAISSVTRGAQRLVSSIGGALRDFKNVRGALPAQILAMTRLRLAASPAPGSIVLDLVPELRPSDELAPGGQLSIDESEDQLVDLALNELVRILTSVHDLGPEEDGSLFLSEVSKLGPRAASALRGFANDLSSNGLELTLDWMQPRRPTTRAFISQSDAQRIERIVQDRKLDAERTALVGLLHTKSDVSIIHLEIAPGEIVAIDRGDLSAEDQRGVDIGDQVEVQVDLVLTQKLGGGESVRYTAVSIRRVPDSGD